MSKILDKIFLSTDEWWYRFIWNSWTRDVVLWGIRHLPLKKNRAVFFNRTGGPYDCNPAYIVDEIVSRNKTGKTIEPWFVLADMSDPSMHIIPEGCGIVEYQQLPYYYIYYTSKFIIVNVIQRHALHKRPEQIAIQTGHGGHGLKKFYYDNPESDTPEALDILTREVENFNLLLSDSDFWSSVIRTSYRYKGTILEKGFPRNCVFFNKDGESNDNNERRYLIYTPTFRFDGCYDMYGFNVDKVVDALEKRFGGTWYIRISAHPLMRSFYHELYDFSHPRLIDVGRENLMPLLVTSDALITDYSSAEMDFSMRDVANIYDKDRHAHPIFQLFRDRNIHDCNFYIELRELPFPYAENDEQLVNNILTFDEEKYLSELDAFHQKIGLCEDGNAASHVVDWMESQIR